MWNGGLRPSAVQEDGRILIVDDLFELPGELRWFVLRLHRDCAHEVLMILCANNRQQNMCIQKAFGNFLGDRRRSKAQCSNRIGVWHGRQRTQVMWDQKYLWYLRQLDGFLAGCNNSSMVVGGICLAERNASWLHLTASTSGSAGGQLPSRVLGKLPVSRVAFVVNTCSEPIPETDFNVKHKASNTEALG